MSKLDDISRRYFNRIAMQLVEQGIPWIEGPSTEGARETIIGEIEENSAIDIEHLLSRLIIAEKASENIGDMIGEEFAEKTKERCSQALKQIRE